MTLEPERRRVARFGIFEADFEEGELRRQGRVVPLQEQPLQVLAALLEHPDQEVSREELRRRLWPDQAFLDFETGINTAVAKLRQALGDSADNPRFIATRPRHGYRFIAPVRWVTDAELTPAAETRPTVSSRSWAIVGAGLLGVGIVLVLLTPWIHDRRISAEADSFDIVAPAGEPLTGSFALSPDGAFLVFVTSGATSADSRLWLRPLNDVTPRVLTGTDGAAMPFWAPDGRRIGFFAGGKLKAFDLETAAITIIADAPRGRGGTWNTDGVILFAPDIASSIHSVPAAGGYASPVTDLGDAPSHRFPLFLPDGRRFVYLVLRSDRDQSEIWHGQLGQAKGEPLLAATSHAMYMDPGYLFFARGPALFAQAFDARLRPQSAAVLVSDRVGTYGEDGPTGLGAFSVSRNGGLAVAEHLRPALQLSWFDRQGHKAGTVGPPAEYMTLDLSPDGRRASVTRFDARKRSSDLLMIDLRTGVVTQLTDDPWPDADPVWAPLGHRLVFGSMRAGRWRNFVRPADRAGPDQPLRSSEDYAYSWMRDGNSLVVGRRAPATGIDLWELPLGQDAEPTPLVIDRGDQTQARVSPDGQWLAYASDHEGRREIYIRGLRRQESRRVSSGGGDIARWREDGRELFYLAGKTLMSVTVRTDPTLEIGSPQLLFDPPLPANDSLGELPAGARFGVAANGSKFLFAALSHGEPRAAIRIVTKWSPTPPRGRASNGTGP